MPQLVNVLPDGGSPLNLLDNLGEFSQAGHQCYLGLQLRNHKGLPVTLFRSRNPQEACQPPAPPLPDPTSRPLRGSFSFQDGACPPGRIGIVRCYSYLYLLRAFLPISLFTLRSSLFSSAALDASPQLHLKIRTTERACQGDASRFPMLEAGAHGPRAWISAAGARGDRVKGWQGTGLASCPAAG